MSDTNHLSETKKALLERLLRGNPTQPGADAGSIPRRARDGSVPLSIRQQQFWLLSKMAPDNPAYNEGVIIHLPSPLDVAALQQSLDEILRRHEVWRTSFPLVNGQPVQLIHPPATFPLPLVDLRHVPEAEQEAEALRITVEDGQTPFDLEQGPLLRARLVRLSDQEYRLLMTIHHIIFDGFSIYQVLIPELTTLYAAFTKGQPSPLPELPIQYADYALWQSEALQGDSLERHLSYWKQHLAGAPGDLVLPSDHPRPPNLGSLVAVQPIKLPRQLNDSLKALCQQEKVTLFMLVLAAFATLLYRYSGQDDIVIGTPTSGRNRPEIQNLLGAFINTLALRTDLSGTPSFRELLQRAKQVTLSALAHEELPFELLVRELQPERTLGQNPIYQVLLTLEPPIEALPSGWGAEQPENQSGVALFDLALTLEERAEGLVGRFEYNVDMFEAPTIERMAGHWLTLLEGIVSDPDQPISRLPLLTEAERHQILVEWNATQAPYPQDQCIQHLFEAQVERTPHAIALVYAGKHLTYLELNQRANQLAHYLQKLGVGPETLVGLYVERSLETVVGVLGILKAGGAYVPLDPNYPQERLAFMLEDTQVPVLLTQQRLLARLPRQNARIICLDTEWEAIAPESPANPAGGATAEQLAYIIYTSGSTGKPKGVMINHAGVVNAYYAWSQAYQLRARCSCHLQMANFAFDVFTGDLVRALGSGGRLVLCPVDLLLDAEGLYALMRREQVDAAEFVPAVLRNLMDYLKKTGQSLDFLKLLVVGSDSWSGREYQEFRSFCGPHTRLINSYGATEASIDSTYFEAVNAPPPAGAVVPIGHPFANMQIYLLDAQLQPVPIGLPGELYIGGRGLARGYLNRPDLTAERFIPHPFSAAPGARLYKTGDLARYQPSGEIEFLGRVDYQVKIRGFRIELGEIEATLARHPQVSAAVVVAREDTPGDKRLVAYIVPASGEPPGSSALRGFLKERLPEHMVPSAFVLLDRLPLTPNGKLDRRALPPPEGGREQLDASFVAPRTPTEEQLAAIWAELLGLEQVGIEDNFFELGGHSLLAVRVLSRVRDSFQVDLPLPSLFQAPTVSTLAIKIVQSQADEMADDVIAQLLAELEQLPDQEAQSILVTEQQSHGG